MANFVRNTLFNVVQIYQLRQTTSVIYLILVKRFDEEILVRNNEARVG